MIVLKFGGTSVGSASMMNQTLDIISPYISQGALLIASAMSKITDSLVAISTAAGQGNEAEVKAAFAQICERHRETAAELLTGEFRKKAEERIEFFLDELHSLSMGLTLLKECTKRSTDALLSFGELLSTTLIAFRAQERGITAEWLDSRQLVKTDAQFTAANPDFATSTAIMNQKIGKEKGKLYIAQGFIGSNEDGVTTTLGRGGSDFSATIYGSCLNAEEVQIWTDVDGIMTCDPRIVTDARTMPTISYEEAAELAFFGAKVVHPSTIQPAVDKNIKVWVKNTKNPEASGTAIVHSDGKLGLRAIAGKKNITLINISSSRMLNAYGFLSKIFAYFEKHKTSVDLVSTSEVSVSVTIDKTENLEALTKDLETLGTVRVETGKSIICLVGKDLWKDSTIISRAFAVLNQIPVRMVTLGSSDINLSVVVPQDKTDEALQKVHAEFFK